MKLKSFIHPGTNWPGMEIKFFIGDDFVGTEPAKELLIAGETQRSHLILAILAVIVNKISSEHHINPLLLPSTAKVL